MVQSRLDLFTDEPNWPIVNVASVPQRSPFRYPGGKTWLVPRIREWLTSLPSKPREFIEPFAGGGIVSLTVAFEKLAQTVTMVEIDEQVASVWKTILTDDAEWLASKVATFNVTLENVEEVLAKLSPDTKEKAFQTILKNRVIHNGILAPGSSLIRNGEGGKGIKSRWYPDTLRKRILNINMIKDRIRFIEGDGLDVLKQNAYCSDTAFFIDPPYTMGGKRAGRRLYTHNDIDHEELFKLAQKLVGDFLITYDNTEEVLEMAHSHGFETRTIPMNNMHHTNMTELLISRDLNWTLCYERAG